MRRRWIEALATGRNPFEGHGLTTLLDGPEKNSGWWL